MAASRPSPADGAGAPRHERSFDAVLFDFGGVLIGSPFAALEEMAGRLDPPVHPELLGELVFGPYHDDTDHAWHRMERGEIGFGEYFAALSEAAVDHGIALDLGAFAATFAEPVVYHHMIELIHEIRGAGYRLGMITNNIREGRDQRDRVVETGLFDVLVDSCEVGMRKPDPRIFHLALERLGGVEPARALFLDDAPGNVEGARRVGLHAILVGPDPRAAEDEVRALLSL